MLQSKVFSSSLVGFSKSLSLRTVFDPITKKSEKRRDGLLNLRESCIANLSPLCCLELLFEKFLVVVVVGWWWFGAGVGVV